MTETERELLSALERNRHAELQATAELTAAINKMTHVLGTFADALLDMAEGNREANQRAREIFRAIREQGEPHGDATKATR
jgi:hypothetical protein